MLPNILKKVKNKITGKNNSANEYTDMETEFKAIYEFCKPYTMTTIERMYALFKAVEYIAKNNIEGDFIECGVWRGGSTMLMAKSLLYFGISNRKIYLYDTYEGMSAPTSIDVTHEGNSAQKLMQEQIENKKNASVWAIAGLEDVKKNLLSTAYPEKQLIFVKGKVEDTIPETISTQIALLRLDTDWYESTRHELIHLYPVLVNKGVLIIDDYGHWRGSREATDQYFKETKQSILLNRIDYTGRLGIKVNF